MIFAKPKRVITPPSAKLYHGGARRNMLQHLMKCLFFLGLVMSSQLSNHAHHPVTLVGSLQHFHAVMHYLQIFLGCTGIYNFRNIIAISSVHGYLYAFFAG